MSPIGAPDFQSSVQQIGPNLLPSVVTTVGLGTTTVFGGLVSSFAAVLLRWQPTAGYGKITLNWWADAAFTQAVGLNGWRVNTSTALVLAHPVRAPYLTVVASTVPAGGMTANSYLAPVANYPGRIYYPIVATEIHQDGVALGAGASAPYLIPFIRPGLAGVNIKPNDNMGQLEFTVRKYNADSTLDTPVANLGQPTGLLYQQVIVPDDIWGVQVTNMDAVNPHTFSLDVVVQDVQ